VRALTPLIIGAHDDEALRLNHKALAQLRMERPLEISRGHTPV
jgi:hypothetical protein